VEFEYAEPLMVDSPDMLLFDDVFTLIVSMGLFRIVELLVVLNAGDFGFKGLLSGIGGHDCPFSVDNSWCSRDVDIIEYCL